MKLVVDVHVPSDSKTCFHDLVCSGPPDDRLVVLRRVTQNCEVREIARHEVSDVDQPPHQVEGIQYSSFPPIIGQLPPGGHLGAERRGTSKDPRGFRRHSKLEFRFIGTRFSIYRTLCS
jgi:hypothetical protein